MVVGKVQKCYSVASKESIIMIMKNTFVSHQEESNFDNGLVIIPASVTAFFPLSAIALEVDRR